MMNLDERYDVLNETPKSKILEVATKLFYDHGYNDTYLEHVAELCGITKPLISYPPMLG